MWIPEHAHIADKLFSMTNLSASPQYTRLMLNCSLCRHSTPSPPLVGHAVFLSSEVWPIISRPDANTDSLLCATVWYINMLPTDGDPSDGTIRTGHHMRRLFLHPNDSYTLLAPSVRSVRHYSVLCWYRNIPSHSYRFAPHDSVPFLAFHNGFMVSMSYI